MLRRLITSYNAHYSLFMYAHRMLIFVYHNQRFHHLLFVLHNHQHCLLIFFHCGFVVDEREKILISSVITLIFWQIYHFFIWGTFVTFFFFFFHIDFYEKLKSFSTHKIIIILKFTKDMCVDVVWCLWWKGLKIVVVDDVIKCIPETKKCFFVSICWLGKHNNVIVLKLNDGGGEGW